MVPFVGVTRKYKTGGLLPGLDLCLLFQLATGGTDVDSLGVADGA